MIQKNIGLGLNLMVFNQLGLPILIVVFCLKNILKLKPYRNFIYTLTCNVFS